MPLFLASCTLTRIVTVSPADVRSNTYTTTTVAMRGTNALATTRVIAADNDISLCLDLQAVAAAFAQSATVEEFENLINNSSYMISNLDLNGDGYVDYLRVLETVDRNAHVFLIQAVLAQNVYQDVATLVAEVPVYGNACVQIIGSPYIYGPNFIIQPVYHTRPLIFTCLLRPAYAPWHSPWYWGHFPPHYRRPAPIYITHYQAYVRTYMQNHAYCHRFDYAPVCHYPEYDRVCREYQRNDYGTKYPERSFTVRNANTPEKVVNAKDIRDIQESRTVTRSASAPSSSSTASAAAKSAPSRSATTSRSSSSGSRSSSVTSSSSSQTSGSRTSSSSQTTVRSTVNNSGTASTRTTTVSPSGQKSTTVRGSSSTSSTRSSTPTAKSSSRSSAGGSSSSSTGGMRSTSSSSSTRSSASTGNSRSSGSSSTSRSGGASGRSSSSGSTRR